MQRLPATVPQLVTASPSATEDGALLLGSHRSSVYVVDAKSGALLRSLPLHTEQAYEEDHAGILVLFCSESKHQRCVTFPLQQVGMLIQLSFHTR